MQKKTTREEWFPHVNEKGETIGKISRKECHSGSKRLHPVIHLHILNDKGELYLQKRSLKKDIQPGKWDTAVGGHIDYGETVMDALYREAKEELGIIHFVPVYLHNYIYESDVEREYVYSYRTIYNGSIEPDMDEVECGRYWKKDEIRDKIKSGIFTPNLEYELNQFSILTE